MLIGFHLVLGVIGLEVTALLIKGAPSGARALGSLGPTTAILTAATLFTGLLIPLIAQPRPKWATPALVVHALVGAVAFALYLIWGSRELGYEPRMDRHPRAGGGPSPARRVHGPPPARG